MQQNLATFKQDQKGLIFKSPGSYLSRAVAPLWRIRPSRNTGLYIGLQEGSVTITNNITKTNSEGKVPFHLHFTTYKKQSHSTNLEAGTRAETTGEGCSLACCLWHSTFLLQGTTCPGITLSTGMRKEHPRPISS